MLSNILTDQEVIQAIRKLMKPGGKSETRVCLHLSDGDYVSWWTCESDTRCTPETLAKMHGGRVTKVTRGEE
jgi:hypothetical protein